MSKLREESPIDVITKAHGQYACAVRFKNVCDEVPFVRDSLYVDADLQAEVASFLSTVAEKIVARRAEEYNNAMGHLRPIEAS